MAMSQKSTAGSQSAKPYSKSVPAQDRRVRDRAFEIASERLAVVLVLRQVDRPLRNDEAATWLTEELGVPMSPGQLANLRVTGGGPDFALAGRYPTYTKSALR